MRRLFFNLSVLLSLSLLVACNTPKEPLVISPSEVTLTHDGAKSVSVNSTSPSLLWLSDNDFVASVENGMIKGLHVGTTTVRAYEDGREAACNVTVEPVYNTFPEPCLEFGITKNALINKIGVPDNSGDGWIGYTIDGWLGIYSEYHFDSNGKYIWSGVAMYSGYADANKFLVERYELVYSDETWYYFVNAMSTQFATLSVQFRFITDTEQKHIWTVYSPASSVWRAPMKSPVRDAQ